MASPIHTDKTVPTQWHILGAGAMGCLWAAALQQTGHAVSLVLRDARQLDRYPGHILVEDPAQQRIRTLAMSAWEPVGGPPAPQRPVRWLMIATKAQDALEALAGVERWLSEDATLVLLQNGLQVQQQLSAQFGDRAWCLSSSHGAWLRDPRHVVQAGTGEAWLGQLRGAQSPAGLLQRLPAQPMRVRHDPAIDVRLWRKFAVNCAVNALTVLYNCRNGELLDEGPRQQHLNALCDEISALLPALAQAPNADHLLTPPLRAQVEAVLAATASNVSSTLQDVRLGRPTELAHLNGYLITLAQQAGLTAPRNAALMEQIGHCARIPAHL